MPLFFYEARSKTYHDAATLHQLKKDYAEFEVTLHDNGDERVCLEIGIGPRRHINLTCDMYMPIVTGDQESEMFG